MSQSERLTLVLLPGMHGTGRLFADFVEALPEAVPTTIVEYPKQEILGYERLQDFVRASCPPSDAFALVAESFSTPLAIEIAAGGPENLRGLVLCAGFATSPARRWRRILAWLILPFLLFPMPGSAASRWLFGKGATPSLVEAWREAVSLVRSPVMARRWLAVLQCDVSQAASQVRVPTLYIQPSNDQLVPVESVEELRRLIPHLEVALVEGGHLILQEQPRYSADIISSFWE